MKTTSYIYLTLAASVALLAGCAKEMDVNVDGASLRFSTNSLEIVSTKAAGEALTGTAAATNRTMNLYSDGKLSDMTLELEESVNTDGLVAATKATEITSLTTFTVAGFDGTTKWFPDSASEQEVTTDTPYDTYKWKSGKVYQFFGYANLPSSSDVASAVITSSGVTLTYTAVPESAGDQEDILLGASYENVPAEGKANMTFFHPLAEVVFNLESSSFGGTSVKVTGITLNGVYKSGTVVCDGDENPYEDDKIETWMFDWTGTTPGSVSQTKASGISISSGVIGVPFMLIPQAFTSGAPLTVNVDLEIDGAAKSFTATLDDITWYSGKKYTYTIKKMVKELYISSLDDLNAFKAQIESPIGSGGKDFSGYTIYLNDNIFLSYPFAGIYDQYSRLKGATFEGRNFTIMGTGWDNVQFTSNANDPNNTSGLFSTLTSDNVTIKNLIIKYISSNGNSASFIAGTYTGSQIIIENCTFEEVQSYNTYETPTGTIIGICKGNATITDCVVEYGFLQCMGNYTSLVIGEADGPINVDIERIRLINFSLKSNNNESNKTFGLYVGHCKNFSGMKIQIKDCTGEVLGKSGVWPAMSDNMYIHTGSGIINRTPTTNHFFAVAWNNGGSDTGLTVSISGMELSDCEL